MTRDELTRSIASQKSLRYDTKVRVTLKVVVETSTSISSSTACAVLVAPRFALVAVFAMTASLPSGCADGLLTVVATLDLGSVEFGVCEVFPGLLYDVC